MGKDNIILIALLEVDSLAIRTLHAALQETGFSVNSIFFKRPNQYGTMDTPSTNEINRLIELIKEVGANLIGISLRSVNFKLASRITGEIKRELDAVVIWGGIHPTIRPHQCIEIADIVCVGEGEQAIVELAAKMSKNEGINNINNLWVKNGDNIVKNDMRPLIQNLDSIPFPDFLNENKYFVENGNVLPLPAPEQIKSYIIMTSRGCPFNCTYCSNNTLRTTYKGKGKYVRRRSVDNVIEELAQAKVRFKNLNYIDFFDDVFTLDIKWLKEFCNQYKKAVNLPFFCLCHPKATNEEVIQLLKYAGVVNMTMGIQTGSEEIRHKYYERYDTNEEIIKSAQILDKYKIGICYDIIMDNPLETEKDRRETLNLLLKLPKPTFAMNTVTLTHFPETKLTNLLLEKKMILETDVEDQKQESYERWITALDLKRDRENLFWDNLYYLATQKHVPKNIAVKLSHSAFLKRHPKALTWLLRTTSDYTTTVRRGSKIDMTRVYLISFIKRLLRVRRLPYLLFSIVYNTVGNPARRDEKNNKNNS